MQTLQTPRGNKSHFSLSIIKSVCLSTTPGPGTTREVIFLVNRYSTVSSFDLLEDRLQALLLFDIDTSAACSLQQ